MLENVACVVLAAGAGTRMKSKLAKVAHEILGKPLVNWVLDAVNSSGINRVISVVGHGREVVEPLVSGKSEVVVQENLVGTGDAVKCALMSDTLSDFEGSVVILSGDSPLIRPETISALVEAQQKQSVGVAVLTMTPKDPYGYGRIIRATEKPAQIARIVEQKDATEDELRICECNSGIYCFDIKALREALSKIDNSNAQKEYYLTDAVENVCKLGLGAIACICEDTRECVGVNSRAQLAEATALARTRINEELMNSGVTLIDPTQVWCGPDVSIGIDCTIYPGVTLLGNVEIGDDTLIYPQTMVKNSKIGSECVLGPNTRVVDTVVGNSCILDETYSIECTIDNNVTCGPRAYLRPETHLCDGSKAGSHVEIKKSTIGKGSKVPHLSYIGDTQMGEGVNIGAGSITCNFDGQKKHTTKIGDNTFVGSDTMMVAPVTIGENAVIGAGSVITKDVPSNALAVARSREKVIDEWAIKHQNQA